MNYLCKQCVDNECVIETKVEGFKPRRCTINDGMDAKWIEIEEKPLPSMKEEDDISALEKRNVQLEQGYRKTPYEIHLEEDQRKLIEELRWHIQKP